MDSGEPSTSKKKCGQIIILIDLGLLQLVRSRFSNIMCPKNEVSWLPEYTEWPDYSINGFFLPQWHRHTLNMTMPGFIRLKLWKRGSRSMRHNFHTRIGHHRVQNLTPLRISGMCWRRLCTMVPLSHHQYKILVKNECNTGQKYILWPCRSLPKQCHSECVP